MEQEPERSEAGNRRECKRLMTTTIRFTAARDCHSIGRMSDWKAIAAVVVVLSQPLPSIAQSPKAANAAPATTSQPDSRESLPFAIPPAMYAKWRKYGLWDYKQQGSQYIDFTTFNFGATGAAAGFDEKSLATLARSVAPTPEDVREIDYPELQSDFERDAEGLDRLRKMAEQDGHVIRIAPDFTLLDTDSSWPRENIGFSEARWTDYRTAFKKLSLSEGIVRNADFHSAIFFVTRAKGLCVGGSSVGYVYSTVQLTPISKSPAEDLDAEARKNPGRPYAYVFKLLKTNWYTFYQIDW